MGSVTRKDGGSMGRLYVVPGEDGIERALPSVTNILGALAKPALIPWAAKQERLLAIDAAAAYYNAIREGTVPSPTLAAFATSLEKRIGAAKSYKRTQEKAAEIGSQAHALIEWELLRRMHPSRGLSAVPKATEPAQYAFEQWKAWADAVELEPLAVEQTVYSLAHGFAGTLDLLARVNGDLAVLDWKASKALYPEYKLQNAAYREAVTEMGLGEPTRGYVVRLPKQANDPGTEIMEIGEADELLRVFLALLEVWKWQAGNEAEYRRRRAA